jgi:hypothetical protein
MGEKGLSWRALRLERSGRLYSLCGLHYEVMNLNIQGAPVPSAGATPVKCTALVFCEELNRARRGRRRTLRVFLKDVILMGKKEGPANNAYFFTTRYRERSDLGVIPPGY